MTPAGHIFGQLILVANVANKTNSQTEYVIALATCECWNELWLLLFDFPLLLSLFHFLYSFPFEQYIIVGFVGRTVGYNCLKS